MIAARSGRIAAFPAIHPVFVFLEEQVDSIDRFIPMPEGLKLPARTEGGKRKVLGAKVWGLRRFHGQNQMNKTEHRISIGLSSLTYLKIVLATNELHHMEEATGIHSTSNPP